MWLVHRRYPWESCIFGVLIAHVMYLKAKSPTIRGPVISFPCSLLLSELLSVLTLLCEDERLSRSSDRQSGSSSSGVNLFSSCTHGFRGRVLVSPCTALRGWCSALPGWWCRPASNVANLRAMGSGYHSPSHFPGKLFINRLCTKTVLILADLLSDRQPPFLSRLMLIPLIATIIWVDKKMSLLTK